MEIDFATHGSEVASHAPLWVGETTVYSEYVPTRGSVEYTAFMNFNRSQFVKITPNLIDTSTKMRCDFELEIGAVEVIGASAIADLLFNGMWQDIADLMVTIPTEQTAQDPLLKYGYNARFMPRSLVREIIISAPDYYAPKIAQDSSFLNEEWYKEWAAA